MKFCVDEIIDNIVKLENMDSNEIIYVDTYSLPNDICENDILLFKEGVYVKDNNIREERIKSITDKMNMLRGSDD